MTRSALAAATLIAATGAVIALTSSPLAAQARRDPVAHSQRLQSTRVPYGLCRVWINGVAPERQPGVTGCAYAYANVPRNGRVIYGGERGQLFERRYSPYFYDERNNERGYGGYDQRDRGYQNRNYHDREYRGRDYRDGDDRRDQSGYGYDYADGYSYGYDSFGRPGSRDSYGWSDRRAGRVDVRSGDRDDRKGRDSWRNGDGLDSGRDNGHRGDYNGNHEGDHYRGHGHWK